MEIAGENGKLVVEEGRITFTKNRVSSIEFARRLKKLINVSLLRNKFPNIRAHPRNPRLRFSFIKLLTLPFCEQCGLISIPAATDEFAEERIGGDAGIVLYRF